MHEKRATHAKELHRRQAELRKLVQQCRMQQESSRRAGSGAGSVAGSVEQLVGARSFDGHVAHTLDLQVWAGLSAMVAG